MENIQVITLVKVAYVVSYAEGFTRETAVFLGKTFIKHIPDFTYNQITDGENMSMRQMVINLQIISNSSEIAQKVFSELRNKFTSSKSMKLLREIEEIYTTGVYSESNMPELAIRISIEDTMY